MARGKAEGEEHMAYGGGTGVYSHGRSVNREAAFGQLLRL
jgi:hypothetical protein